MSNKRISLEVHEEVHGNIKKLCVDEKTTMREYLLKLIKQDFKKRKLEFKEGE